MPDRLSDLHVAPGPCDICGGDGPHGLAECRENLLKRVRSVQERARTLPAIRTSPLKDQSGVALSEAFMRIRGLGRYSARETANTLANRVTEPITLDHFVVVISERRCLACAVGIKCIAMPGGGKFWICEDEGCGWYIGWRAAAGKGEQVRLKSEAA